MTSLISERSSTSLGRQPALLVEGDTIGIVSPSSAVASLCPRRFKRGISELERRGFRLRIAENALARTGHTAGSRDDRLRDLHAMFSAPEVRAIISTIGGFSSHQLLDDLDFNLIRENPKFFVGYSDMTALFCAIWSRGGRSPVLGPAVLPQFGEYGGIDEYSWAYFKHVLMSDRPPGTISSSAYWIHERLAWDKEDTRPRSREPNSGPRTLKEGEVTGFALGGNAGSLLLLAGTPYWPALDGAVLFLEEDEQESPATLDRHLTHLRQLGAYEQVKGIVFGRLPPEKGFGDSKILEDLLLEATRGFDFPIAIDMNFGHTDPMFIVPFGMAVRLECGHDGVSLEMLEPAGAPR